jgi:methyl-accepting chemotaxis protein
VTLDSVPRWLGWTWLIGGVAAVVGALVGVVAGWVMLGAVGTSVNDTVAVTRRALVAVGDTTQVVNDVFGDVARSLRDVQLTLSDTSLTLTRASVVTGRLGDVITEDIPSSVEAVRAALPALADTARVVDTTMRGLAFFGVAYDPDVPLHVTIATIDEELERIPELLTAQQETLEAVAADLGSFSSSTLEIAEQLASIRGRLAEATVILDGYREIVEDSAVLLDEVESGAGAAVGTLRAVALLVGFGVAVTQTLPMAAGWAVLRATRPPEDEVR